MPEYLTEPLRRTFEIPNNITQELEAIIIINDIFGNLPPICVRAIMGYLNVKYEFIKQKPFKVDGTDQLIITDVNA